MNDRIALGMFTVHQNVREDLLGAFRKLADMGYTGIEFYGEPADFPVSHVVHALEVSGFALTSWHIEWKNLQEATLDATAAYLNAVHCPIAVVPCLGGKWNVNHTPDQESEALWNSYVIRLNEIAGKLKDYGIRMGYHNHEHEFLLQYGGKTVFDILFQGLSRDIILELDTGNCIEGGYDPSTVLKNYADRDVLLHLKPFSHTKGFDVVSGDSADENDWSSIVQANPGKVLWHIIESENTLFPEMVNAERCIQAYQKL